ncbi:hypothetical protein K7432_008179 [Basidiobolus ranarum]|uniref:Uncharacterized protein n=1 Tax=Basidiobolus ranarum TaxID=34480 RepID=A0ABR2VZD9_9FUNG
MKATLLNSLFLIASCSAGIMYMPKGAIEDNRLFLAESSNHQYSPQVTDNLEYIDEKPTTHPEIDHGSNKEYSGPKDANNGKHPYLHVGEETHPESNKKSESVISHMKEKNDSEKTNGDYHKTKEHNGAHSVEETDYVESTQKHGTKHMDKYTNNSKGNKVHHSEYQHPEKPTSKDDYDNAKTEKSQHVPNIDQESKPDHSKEESHTFNEMVGATEEPDYNEKVYKYGDQYVDKPSHGSRNSHYVVREYKQKDNHGDDGAISSYNNEKSGARASPKIGNGKDYEQQNSHRNSDNDHKPKINAKDGSKIKDHNQPKDTSIRYNDGPDSAIKKDDYSHENNDKSEVAPEHKRKPLDGKKPTGDDHGATNKPKDIYKKETHEKAKDKKISNSDKLDDSHNYSGMKKTPKDNGKASESYKPSKHAVSLDRQSPANKNPFAEKNSHNTDTKDTPKKIHKPAANNEYKNENAPSDKIKPKEQSGYSSQNDHKSASDRKTDNKNKSTGNDNYKGKEKPKNFHDSGKKSTNKEIGNKDKSAKKDHTYGNNDQSAAEGKKAHDKSKGNTGKSVDNYKSTCD